MRKELQSAGALLVAKGRAVLMAVLLFLIVNPGISVTGRCYRIGPELVLEKQRQLLTSKRGKEAKTSMWVYSP